ncbi:hypothetical protein [Acinetobacter haemolyticus]|uniref:hypothetical protein n=1 Tax=Acinetobacter haemolyticus TaxID=29430 RepID=UPI003F563AE9
MLAHNGSTLYQVGFKSPYHNMFDQNEGDLIANWGIEILIIFHGNVDSFSGSTLYDAVS